MREAHHLVAADHVQHGPAPSHRCFRWWPDTPLVVGSGRCRRWVGAGRRPPPVELAFEPPFHSSTCGTTSPRTASRARGLTVGRGRPGGEVEASPRSGRPRSKTAWVMVAARPPPLGSTACPGRAIPDRPPDSPTTWSSPRVWGGRQEAWPRGRRAKTDSEPDQLRRRELRQGSIGPPCPRPTLFDSGGGQLGHGRGGP